MYTCSNFIIFLNKFHTPYILNNKIIVLNSLFALLSWTGWNSQLQFSYIAQSELLISRYSRIGLNIDTQALLYYWTPSIKRYYQNYYLCPLKFRLPFIFANMAKMKGRKFQTKQLQAKIRGRRNLIFPLKNESLTNS